MLCAQYSFDVEKTLQNLPEAEDIKRDNQYTDRKDVHVRAKRCNVVDEKFPSTTTSGEQQSDQIYNYYRTGTIRVLAGKSTDCLGHRIP